MLTGCASGSDSVSTTIEPETTIAPTTHPLGNVAGRNFDFEWQAWTCELDTDLNSVDLARSTCAIRFWNEWT